MKSRFWNFIFWLVIAAAFVGPGTVTTAASAGAGHGFDLLWALLFSMLACIVLQEAAARVTIASGRSLGQALKERFKSSKLVWTIAIAIFLGCAAYEAGNILGAISGLALFIPNVQKWLFTLLIVAISASVLLSGKTTTVANVLGILVAVMGLAFLSAALSTPVDMQAMTKGLFIPSVSSEKAVLVLGLVGTTIVPYNIFLGSGLAEGQTMKQMRSGLIASIILGGIISMAVLIVGTNLQGQFSFENLYQALIENFGGYMGYVLGIGLFAAGFTSSITAALAGAITVKSVTGNGDKWTESSLNYRLLWVAILATGLVFGVLDIRPVPVIILAQAANGLILPLLAFAIWVLVNNRDLMSEHVNSAGLNLAMLITVWVSSLLGFINVFKALSNVLSFDFTLSGWQLYTILILATATVLLSLSLINKRKTRS